MNVMRGDVFSREMDSAWQRLKYRCKDVGGSHVKLEVSIGDFKSVLIESLHNQYDEGYKVGSMERKDL